jgi:hypothetical protein
MNKSVPSPKNWPDDGRARKLKMKRSGIRAIDQGTSYDISAKLRKLAREIECGKHGEVRGIVCAIGSTIDGRLTVNSIYTGKASIAELHMLASYLEKRTGVQ